MQALLRCSFIGQKYPGTWNFVRAINCCSRSLQAQPVASRSFVDQQHTTTAGARQQTSLASERGDHPVTLPQLSRRVHQPHCRPLSKLLSIQTPPGICIDGVCASLPFPLVSIISTTDTAAHSTFFAHLPAAAAVAQLAAYYLRSTQIATTVQCPCQRLRLVQSQSQCQCKEA